MPADIFRDSTAGQLLRLVSPRLFPYPDERPDYVVPAKYLVNSGTSSPEKKLASSETLVADRAKGDAPKVDAEDPEKGPRQQEGDAADQPLEDLGETLQRVASGARQGVEAGKPVDLASSGYIVVDWDGPDDPANPQNWSDWKRRWVVAQIMLLTFSVYIGSAIYVPSITGIMEHFGVSQVRATWGMTLFIFAYGFGPMLLTPVQDMHRFGRNPVYVWGLLAFCLLQLPIAYAPNLATILAFRFITGFVGSPALATGGASLGDIAPPPALPLLIACWAMGAVCGPVLGPVIGGFAAQANGWQWPIFILAWISAFAFIVLFVSFPETLASKILYDRARRLRKLTGNPMLRSEGEIQARGETPAEFWKNALLRPLQLFSEPSVLFSNIYLGLCYAIFYLWFESFPIVFNEIYGFGLGVGGLPYLGFIVAAIFTLPLYVLYLRHLDRRWVREGGFPPEVRLQVAFLGSFGVPISILLFGWLGRQSIHWMAPLVVSSFFMPSLFLIFQGILLYVATSYPPKDAASILAGNDLARSSLASVFPLFGGKYFKSALGLGGGSTLLAGVAAMMIPILYALMKKGAVLRARSRYAH